MSEFFFVLKTILFSALLLMVLQMKVGGATLEQHSENWIYQSRVGGEMQAVARGAVRAGYEGWSWLKFQTQDKIGGISNGHESTTESTREMRERSYRARPRTDDLD